MTLISVTYLRTPKWALSSGATMAWKGAWHMNVILPARAYMSCDYTSVFPSEGGTHHLWWIQAGERLCYLVIRNLALGSGWTALESWLCHVVRCTVLGNSPY